MFLDLLVLTVGLTLLLGGGESLVRGASALARHYGVSPLAVGLTVVAFGTSAPELAVNVSAAWRGSTSLSFGNIFGSNMANIGIVLALGALLRPLPIGGMVISRELPMMLLATSVALVMALDVTLGRELDQLDRGDGLVLLLLFCVFLYYTVGDLVRRRAGDRENGEAAERGDGVAIFRNLMLTVAGTGALIAGADLTVDAAVSIAVVLAVPQVVIGLTLVAIGTSLPELATVLIAVRHGKLDLAVGNVVGSNIFNILLVGGATASLRPIPIPPLGHADLVATAVLSLSLLWVAMTYERRIIRVEAILLIVTYFGYLTWRTAQAAIP